MIKKYVVFLFFIWTLSSPAQEYTNYSEKDGLPSNNVYKVTQDINGFIWMATNEGVVKFNGSEFKIFTTKDGLPTNDVWNLFPARDGKMWYGAKSKSMGYIFEDKVYNFPSANDQIMSATNASFDGDEILAIGSTNAYQLKGDLWQIVSLRPFYDFSVPLLGDKFKSISENAEENFILTDKNNKTYTLKGSNILHNNYHRGQLTDSLYFTFKEYFYNLLNLNSKEIKSFRYEDELGVQRLERARMNLVNDQIQITGDHVVGILDSDLSIKTAYHIPSFIASHNSFIDKENNIWAATFSNGVYKYNVNDLDIKKEYSNYQINDIKNINGTTYAIINDQGFYSYDKAKNEFILDLKKTDYLYDLTYIQETDTKYYMSNYDIQTVHKNQKTGITFPLKNELARSLVYFNDLLYGYNTIGVSSINPKNLDFIKAFPQPGTRCLSVFKQQLIIGTSTGLKRLVDGKIEDLNTIHKEFSYPVNGITIISNDQILLTTDGYGAYLTDLTNIHLLEKSEFLSCDHAFFENQELYLPTNNGIYQYTFANESFQLQRTWNRSNGLPTNKINGVEKVGDVLLVATNQGIIHLPIDYKVTSSLVNIFIEEAVYNGQAVCAGQGELYSRSNTLSFTVNSIDYRPYSKLSYQFKLSPSQKEWTTTTSKNITFSDLSPEEYQLEIRSGDLIKSFDFKVLPRWYQSWIFYIALLLLLVAVIIYITKYLAGKSEIKRNEELLRSKELSELQLKALRSQMNPHFVFNSLTAIQYYINENDFETSDRYLVKFSRLIREFFELSKEQLVSVNREIQLLSNYLALEQLRFKGKLNYIFEIDPELDRTDQLPSMLLQPIVENAVNHGVFNKETTGTVLIKFQRISKEKIQISIQDDGKGYENSKEDDRFKSTSVLEDRLKYLRESGIWEINVERKDAFPDKKDKGHKVSFLLKRLTDEKI